MTLRTAVIGVGISGPSHLAALDRNPKTMPTAVCDLDENKADEFADIYNANSYTEISDMLSTEVLDWVHICTPVQSHIDIATQVVNEKVPVLIQKPISKNSTEVEELESLANKKGVQVSVIHNRKYTPLMRRVREKVKNKELGEVRSVNTIYTGIGEPDDTPRGSWVFDLPGGELEEGLSHAIYLTLDIGGYPASNIGANTVKTKNYKYDIKYDGVHIRYTSENNAFCNIIMLSDSSTQNKIIIHGTQKTLEVDLASMLSIEDSLESKSPKNLLFSNLSHSFNILQQTMLNILKYPKFIMEKKFDIHSDKSFSSTYYQINETAKSIQNNTSPPVPVSEAKWTVRLTEEVHSNLTN